MRQFGNLAIDFGLNSTPLINVRVTCIGCAPVIRSAITVSER
jgi:hypothetical protein